MSLPSRLQAEGAGTGTGVCTIAYFNASSIGTDRWLLEGVVQADDLSAVTIALGGAAASVGLISPDQYGMFSFEIDALAYDYVSAEASDGIASSNASLTLYDML